MASAVISSVPTTASRFALLQVDSGSGSDSESGKGRSNQSSGKMQTTGNKSTINEKKKEKRRKKKEQQQSEANELRNLAFKKIPPKASHGACFSLHEQGFNHTGSKDSQEEDWQQWRQRDEQLTSEMFEADLEKALLLSKLEYEEHRKRRNCFLTAEETFMTGFSSYILQKTVTEFLIELPIGYHISCTKAMRADDVAEFLIKELLNYSP